MAPMLRNWLIIRDRHKLTSAGTVQDVSPTARGYLHQKEEKPFTSRFDLGKALYLA